MTSQTNLIYQIKELETVLRPRYLEALTDQPVTWTQYTALTVLERRPGITSSELARRSFVTAQSMASTINPLLTDGLVRRAQDPEHARRMLLFLTPAGSRVIAKVAPSVQALEDELGADLSAAERVVLSDLLRRCRRALGDAPRTE
jgi:DNA-binding MarR family transcriptional regulator